MLHDHVIECIGAIIFLLLVFYSIRKKKAADKEEQEMEKILAISSMQELVNFYNTAPDRIPPEEMEEISRKMWQKIDAYEKALLN